MKYRLLLFCLIPLFTAAQADSVSAGVYQWQTPKKEQPVILFEGAVHDFSWMQASSNNIDAGKISSKLSEDVEQLLIIHSGTATLNLNGLVYPLIPGSIATILPGQAYSLTNKTSDACNYYLFKYKGKHPINKERQSTVINWSDIKFTPHDKGGIRNFMEQQTAMSKRLEIHATTLNAGIKSHEPHTHRAEEMVIMIEGQTEMQIGQSFYKGKAGDIYFLKTNVLHAIRNEGAKPCMYFAIQFE